MSRSLRHVTEHDTPAPAGRSTTPANELRIVPIAEPDCRPYIEPVDKAVSHAARRYRLSPDDADDLRSDVWQKLLEHRGRILRHLGHLERFDVYLMRVARNLVLDKRNKEWGKWRPSAAARRAGETAVVLDRLITRDGMSVDEAAAWLRCAGREPDSTCVHDAASRLPTRHPRRFVNHDALADLSSSSPSPFELSAASESAADVSRLKRALASTFAALPAVDRDLITRRYFRSMSVADIAAADGVDAKRLYRTFSSILARLGRDLVAAGIDRAMARRLLQIERLDWDCGLPGLAPALRSLDRKPA